MRIRYVANACFLITLSNGKTLLTDPWIEGPCQQTWYNFPPVGEALREEVYRGRPAAIYISHDLRVVRALAHDAAGILVTGPDYVFTTQAGAISITVSPTTATVNSGGTQQFTAQVLNTGNTSVTWTATAGSMTATPCESISRFSRARSVLRSAALCGRTRAGRRRVS